MSINAYRDYPSPSRDALNDFSDRDWDEINAELEKLNVRTSATARLADQLQRALQRLLENNQLPREEKRRLPAIIKSETDPLAGRSLLAQAQTARALGCYGTWAARRRRELAAAV